MLVVVRTPPEVSLYHRHGNPLFADVLERLGTDPKVQAVVLPRTPAQRDALREAALPSLVLPEHAIDAQSLIALADLVVSAGGTMNREAVALGTPVWTTFAGTMGAVDEGLIADGRLAELTAADALVLEKKATGGGAVVAARSRADARPVAVSARGLSRGAGERLQPLLGSRCAPPTSTQGRG